MTWILVPFFWGSVSTECFRSGIAFSRFCIMLRNGIAQFVGSWVSQFGYSLRVEKVRRDRPITIGAFTSVAGIQQ